MWGIWRRACCGLSVADTTHPRLFKIPACAHSPMKKHSEALGALLVSIHTVGRFGDLRFISCRFCSWTKRISFGRRSYTLEDTWDFTYPVIKVCHQCIVYKISLGLSTLQRYFLKAGNLNLQYYSKSILTHQQKFFGVQGKQHCIVGQTRVCHGLGWLHLNTFM